MRIAISQSGSVIASRVDLAQKILVVECDKDLNEQRRYTISMSEFRNPLSMVNRLRGEGISTFICGAVSAVVLRLLRFNNIQVLSWIVAPVDEALELFKKGTLTTGYCTAYPEPPARFPGEPFGKAYAHKMQHRRRRGRPGK